MTSETAPKMPYAVPELPAKTRALTQHVANIAAALQIDVRVATIDVGFSDMGACLNAAAIIAAAEINAAARLQAAEKPCSVAIEDNC